MSPLQSNLLEHFVGVRAVPVNTITGRTPREALMSEIDIWRDLLEDGFFVDVLEYTTSRPSTRSHRASLPTITSAINFMG